ncbi:DegV family protein [Caproiciproducens faecalis]|uniref:DegV family protein n=1 Tax=Caproiciproducens faecalis TaxID=2820301 RepID=A0ABS7DN51_9FIRM|nr:DegV family protein [Caproiciproducens faecalis]MBW7572728.1 DegV family protein [Caproiciproducens faecalis]
MNDYVIVTDSSCDLTAEMARDLELTVLPLSFSLTEKEYRNYLDGRDLSFKDFYRHIRAGEICTTSAVNVEAFVGAIEPILQSGRDVLCAAFSSGLSNTCNAAQMACKELAEKYPQRRVYTVDTLCASMGQGLLIYHAVQQKRSGKTIDEVRNWLEENRLHLCHWFTVEDLNHLKRGGRISATTALIGTMLNIKPVLHVDDEGHLINVGKARGRHASLTALVDHMEETAIDPASQVVFISHGDSQEDADFVAEQVKSRFGVKTVVTNYVGPVIGAHSGPGTIALFFLGTHR